MIINRAGAVYLRQKEGNEMSDCVETMFSVREKPWHYELTKEVTKIIQEAPNSEEALKAAGLDWIVEPKPVFTEIDGIFGKTMQEIPGFKANTRNVDGAVLGIVTDAYKIVQNTDAFAFTDALIGGDVRYETAGSLQNGKRTWLLARLPETEIVGDKVERYLVFTNTFDGSGSVRVACTPVRVVCQNTLNCALHHAKRSWSIRHTANINDRLVEAHHALQLEDTYIEELKKNAELLATRRLSDAAIDKLILQLFPIAEDASPLVAKRNAERKETFRIALDADDLQNFRNTKWQFVNAAADMADHAQPLRVTQTGRENRLKDIFAGHPLLDRAYELVMAM